MMVKRSKMDYMVIVICICSGLHFVTSQTFSIAKVETGNTVVISCSLNGSFTLPEWRGPPSLAIYAAEGSATLNPALSNFHRLQYANNNRDLIIKNAHSSDLGEYKCSVAGIGFHSVDLSLTIISTTTSSTSTSIITSPTITTATHLVTPNSTVSTSSSTSTTATASISTSTTTTTSIKSSTRTTNSAPPSQIVTQSGQNGSKTVVIVVPSVVGGLFVIGVAVLVALFWKFRKNKTLHNKRSNHQKEGQSKNENKGRHLKRHPEYFENISTHHQGFSAKELYGYKMYFGQSEIKRNPLYSYHLDRHMNMLYVTNRGQHHYDQLYNGHQFLGYQMPSARADPLYTRRGHMIHPEHRYQYSTKPRATTLRTQDNTIVTDYSRNWN